MKVSIFLTMQAMLLYFIKKQLRNIPFCKPTLLRKVFYIPTMNK